MQKSKKISIFNSQQVNLPSILSRLLPSLSRSEANIVYMKLYMKRLFRKRYKYLITLGHVKHNFCHSQLSSRKLNYPHKSEKINYNSKLALIIIDLVHSHQLLRIKISIGKQNKKKNRLNPVNSENQKKCAPNTRKNIFQSPKKCVSKTMANTGETTNSKGLETAAPNTPTLLIKNLNITDSSQDNTLKLTSDEKIQVKQLEQAGLTRDLAIERIKYMRTNKNSNKRQASTENEGNEPKKLALEVPQSIMAKSTAIAVVHRFTPVDVLSDDTLKEIQVQIYTEIDKSDYGKGPNFIKWSRECGYMEIICANEYSVQWLKQAMEAYGQTHEPVSIMDLESAKKMIAPKSCKVSVLNSSKNNWNFLKTVGKQNFGITFNSLKPIGAQVIESQPKGPSTTTYTFQMDAKSAAYVRNLGNYIFYGGSMLKVEFIDQS